MKGTASPEPKAGRFLQERERLQSAVMYACEGARCLAELTGMELAPAVRIEERVAESWGAGALAGGFSVNTRRFAEKGNQAAAAAMVHLLFASLRHKGEPERGATALGPNRHPGPRDYGV